MGRRKYTPEIHAYRMEIYSQKLCDRLLAREFGTTQGGVRSWRHKYKLDQFPDEGAGSMPAPITAEEYQRRMDAYNQGLSDMEAGRRLGMTTSCFQMWHKLYNLEAHFTGGKKASPKYKRSATMWNALPPEGCQLVNGFLRCLVAHAKQVPAGHKVDVATFMEQWRKHEYGTNWPGYAKGGGEMRG